MENKTLKINEIFTSIQGEGIQSGLPTIFIRLTGCNLRCNWCDTKYAYNKGRDKNLINILKEIKKFKIKNICITGGEPLLQKNLLLFIRLLIEEKYKILIETNGSLDVSLIPKEVLISLDIKCPSSNESKKNLLSNLKFLKKKDQCKFVINDYKDYLYAKRIIKKYNLIKKINIFFTPVGGKNARNLVEWILKDKLNIRIGLQIHKIIWGDKKRGV